MHSKFYNKYKDKSNEDLFKMVYDAESYQSELIVTIKEIIEERGQNYNLQEYLNERSEKEYRRTKKKADYFYELSFFQEKGIYRSVSLQSGPILEKKLLEKGIHFLKQDKIKGSYYESFNEARFYFFPEDEKVVDEVIIELGWADAPTPIKHFFTFKNVVIVILLLLLFILLFINEWRINAR